MYSSYWDYSRKRFADIINALCPEGRQCIRLNVVVAALLPEGHSSGFRSMAWHVIGATNLRSRPALPPPAHKVCSVSTPSRQAFCKPLDICAGQGFAGR